MKNAAEITNDGASVYLDATIKPDTTAKVALLLANLFAFSVFGIIVYATWGNGIPRFSLFSIYIMLPGIYCATLGRLTLWNLYGKEHVIINTKSLAYRREYGFFSTGLKVLPHKNLHYTIKETDKPAGEPQGLIRFAQHNHLGLSVNLFSTAISLPIKQLERLADQVRFLFALEQIRDPEYDVIHLN